MPSHKCLFLLILLLVRAISTNAQQDGYSKYLFYDITSSNINAHTHQREYNIDLRLIGKNENNSHISFHPYIKINDSLSTIDLNNEIQLTQYLRDDDVLYSRIRNGEEIRSAYIQKFNLEKLGSWIGRKFIIDVPIRLSNCIIDEVVFPNGSHIGTIGEFDTVVFNKKFDLDYCTFSLHAENLIFNDSVSLIGIISPFNELMSYYFVNTIFNSHLHILPHLYPNTEKIIKSNHQGFYARTLQELEFSNCRFKKLEISSLSAFSKFQFDRCLFQEKVKATLFDTTSTLKFRNSIFKSTVTFLNLDSNIILQNCSFKDTLDLYDTKFSSNIGDGFFKCSFLDNTPVLVNPDFLEFSKLNFNLKALHKIHFPFLVKAYDRDFMLVPMTTDPNFKVPDINTIYIDSLDESLFDRSQNFYQQLQIAVRQKYGQYPLIAEKLSKKYDHQALQYEMQFHKEEISRTLGMEKMQHVGRWIALSFTEAVVGNGYNGEDNFFITVLIVATIFGVIYFFFFKKKMLSYILEPGEQSAVPIYKKGKLRRPVFDNLIKCLWISSIILINPRFPRKYFSFHGWLFAIVCIEWIFGIGLIILFLVYIAVEYPFVKALIGV